MSDESPHEKSLFKVFIWGTAISFGILRGLIGSMRNFFAGNAQFQFSVRTIIGLAAGILVGWLFWKFILKRASKKR